MKSFHLILYVTVIGQLVSGVPLLNRVKRQIPQDTNELGETYPAENPSDIQNSQPNNIPNVENVSPNNDAPKVDPNAPMVGADNSPYRKYQYAPGYGGTAAVPDNSEAGAAPGNEGIAAGSNEPEIPPAIPDSPDSPLGGVEIIPGNQNTDINIPQSGESSQNQYETVEGQTEYVAQQNPNLQAGVPPPGPQENINPAGAVPQPGYGVQENINPQTDYGVQENLNPADAVPQPDYGVQENMNPQTDYGVQENLNPANAVPQPGYGVQENVNPQTDYGVQQNPNLPADYGVQENLNPAAGGPQPDFGVPQNLNDVNPQYNPQDPQIGIGGPVVAGPFAPQNQQPVQPADSGLNLPQNQINDQQYNPNRVSDTGLQQPVQGLAVQNLDNANQQYTPHEPLQQTELGPPLQQTEVEPPLFQPDEIGQFGDANQQYNPNPPEVPGPLENQQMGGSMQPQSGYGAPLQGENTSYEPAAGYQDIPEGNYVEEQPIQPAVEQNNRVNTTEPPQYDTIGTELPDSLFWPSSDYFADYKGDTGNLVDQYYSYDSEDENFPFFDNQEVEQDPFDWYTDESDQPFDPYESLDDESYENMLKQEIEDFKDVGLFGNSFEKQDSPTDRLQPNVYTNWQIDNSQPPSTFDSQAANNFLLYCIPAVLLTLVLYIGYSNYNRKPKIVNIPSGNNWRAEYRDIEAKSKEIEPMLRKSEMY